MFSVKQKMKSMSIIQDTWYFQSQKKALPFESLPPTKDVLYLHFDRINYQCHQWKMAVTFYHELSDLTDYAWVNPLQPGVAYLYPLKTSENLKGF